MLTNRYVLSNSLTPESLNRINHLPDPASGGYPGAPALFSEMIAASSCSCSRKSGRQKPRTAGKCLVMKCFQSLKSCWKQADGADDRT